MANPKGNPGNRGGGRKSAYQENADAKAFHDLFFKAQSQEAIETKIHNGKFSLMDRYALNGMEGDTRVLNKIVDKLLPDGIDLRSNGETLATATLTTLTNEQLEQLAAGSAGRVSEAGAGKKAA
jgi:type VI protein secretion system component Hcp